MTVSNVVTSPVTGDVIAEISNATAEEVDAAVSRARDGAQVLGQLSAWKRAELLHATADAIERRREAILADHVLEHGKTLAETDGEISVAVRAIRSTAEDARRLEGRMPHLEDPDKRAYVQRAPLGIVGVITPWNAPVLVPFEYIAPALAVGNTVVWKPAESVPYASRHVASAIGEAGWPSDTVQVVEGGPSTGAALASNPSLDGLCFTGSSEVGDEIARHGSRRRLILELGGNGPTCVFADADIELAALRIVEGACFFSGQSCAATERVLVEAPAHDELVAAIVSQIANQRLGDPRHPDTTVGPVHLAAIVDKLRRHCGDATARGARILAGGRADQDAPTANYWQPTVIADVTPEMDVFSEESFGPIIPVARFSSEEEALNLAGLGGYGLSSAVFTSDLSRALHLADRLPASFVVVNNTSNYWETHLPWGGGPGTKSGTGRLGGDHALYELSTTKTTVVDFGSSQCID
jgi:acyl-CoA reductase-like NAD-dependent aldehyde dehydrogenase